MRLRLAAALTLALMLLTGCARPDGDELLVFAAASMADAMEEIGERFGEETGTKVVFSFGGSQALAQQIASGAPADVFVAAGRPPMDFLVSRNAVDVVEDAVVHNELVVAVREGFPDLGSMSDLAGPAVGKVAIADPDLAPAGIYGREALGRLGLWELLLPALVFGADVRAALAYLESGNVDAALVYATDAREAPGVRALDIVPAGQLHAHRIPRGGNRGLGEPGRRSGVRAIPEVGRGAEDIRAAWLPDNRRAALMLMSSPTSFPAGEYRRRLPAGPWSGGPGSE